MSRYGRMTPEEESRAFWVTVIKSFLFAAPFIVWLTWVMSEVEPKLTTAGGFLTVLTWASAFAAGFLAFGTPVSHWRPWQRIISATGLIVLALLLGYLVMTAEWLRYAAS